MKTIVFCSFKGSTGKTITANVTAYGLAPRGKVIGIDTDPQGDFTKTLKCNNEYKPDLFNVLNGENPITDAIQHTEMGIDVITSSPMLTTLNVPTTTMKASLDFLSSHYAYAIIDTPPTPIPCTVALLSVADLAVVTCTPDSLAIDGAMEALDMVQKKKTVNPSLMAGLLLTRYNGRARLHRAMKSAAEGIAKTFNTKFFCFTRETIKAQESQALKIPLLIHAKKFPIANDYLQYLERLSEVIA